MDYLDFKDVSFRANTNIGRLCENLSNIVGQCTWYDTFKIKNSQRLWLLNNIFAVMNKHNILCGCFGLYSSFVAGILNSVKQIHFYVLCNEELDYADYTEKCIAGKNCCISYKSHTGDYFRLSFKVKQL